MAMTRFDGIDRRAERSPEEERMQTRSTPGRARSEAGFSMVEALIAAAILLIIAIGMIPLFTHSMVNNALGSDYTQATTFGKTSLERIYKGTLANGDLVLTAGTSLQRIDYIEKSATKGTPVSDLDWKYTVTNPSALVWTRTMRVRQFSFHAVDDGVLTDAEVLPAGSDTSQWQVKEISLVLDSGKRKAGVQSPLASIRQTVFQIIKSI
jgi:Tfp pilus assembly protein PilV